MSSVLDDLKKIPEYRDPGATEVCSSLISKYDIPIDHFEFEYIEQCKDGRELEKILQVLRSGEEGHYPDLLKSTEERLRVIKPKSRHLRKACPVLDKSDLKQEEIEELSNDLQHFVVDVNKKDKELESRKSKKQHIDVDIRKSVKGKSEEKKDNEKRIKSTDYSSWDKYDPDTEILKMDLEEEKQKKAALEEKEKLEKVQKLKPKHKKSVTFNKFATEAEASFFSERDREKGNEFFKAGDFQEALNCYTSSIQSRASVNNLNNRAVTYLKLKKYEEALQDCNRVLTLDKDNPKANNRKAEALEKMGRFEEALEAIESVIQVDPNNTVAQDLANRIRQKCCRKVQNTRMKIMDVDE